VIENGATFCVTQRRDEAFFIVCCAILGPLELILILEVIIILSGWKYPLGMSDFNAAFCVMCVDLCIGR